MARLYRGGIMPVMRIGFGLVLVFCLCLGCIKPEARGLKRPDKPSVTADWGSWERPGFSLAAPESWSPYLSRVPFTPGPRPDGEPLSSAPQWTIQDKSGDEARIEQEGKAGIPLRLYDNGSHDASGRVTRHLSVQVQASDKPIPEEIEAFRKALGPTLKAEGNSVLPVGSASVFEWKEGADSKTAYLLVDNDRRFVFEFVNTDAVLAQQIMETFRAKG